MSNKDKILKECDGLFYEFVRNSKGTLIKKCCASCKFKKPYDDDGPRRMCTIEPEVKNRIVNKRHVCRDWEISEEINKVKTAVSKPIENNDNE